MKHRYAMLSAAVAAIAAAYGAEVSVRLDGRDATGVYSENGSEPVAFDGSFSSGAEKIEVLLKRGETRLAGEKYRTWSADPALESAPPLTNAACMKPAALPPAAMWPRGASRGDVPRPFWSGHSDAVECYFHAFARTGGAYLRLPDEGSGFVRPYAYTPFGSSVFMWGTCFISMYGRYAGHVFPFIDALDNFYAHQDSDGFIPRQIDIHTGESVFEKNDLSSLGGNIMAWAEWRSFEWTGDTNRLARVYPRLLAFHRYMRRHRTWKDGTYFASGWGCGMDNIPRISEPPYHHAFDHGHLSFVDVTLQQAANARFLLRIASVLGAKEGVPELEEEYANLKRIANGQMWDEATGVYKDLDRNGKRIATAHTGTFWALLAGVADAAKTERLASAAFDPRLFGGKCGIASTAISDPGFVADGGNYWAGGCWCIMDYMAAKGFEECGRPDVAHRIAMRSVEAVAKVYGETGAIWESYSPTEFAPGKNWGHFVRKFVGFSGTVPVALLFENVLGVRAERTAGGRERIVWDIRLDEDHGIENLVLPDGSRVDLAFRGGKPRVSGAENVDLEIFVGGKPWRNRE